MTEHSGPLVSVCIITYNQEKYISQAIESVLAQDINFPIEILIGDDQSTDATGEIVAEFEKNHPSYIRAIPSSTNLGANRNLARLLKEAKGKYIALLEGDDFWISARKLQKQISFLNEYPECAICFHKAERYFQKDHQSNGVWPESDPPIISTIENLAKLNYISTCTVMYRNVDLGDIPQRYYELGIGDWPLHMMYAQKGKIGFINETMSRYRIHSDGVFSSLSTLQKFEKALVAREFIFSQVSKPVKNILGGVIIDYCCRIAQMSLSERNTSKAKYYLRKGLSYFPYFEYYDEKRAFWGLYMKAYSPRLYSFLSGLKRSEI